ncbi:hypothetical protein DJ019_18825 [Phenylobacterium kunshanense]|uniref:Uncharacterized protein n=1 Tax=Phenylobacterium kunshanense TaxID=1445034 RepID=A0A328B6F4_9CAUL|nr:hypothetical protein DJ019_18825 [Phenylobacterium kunshanense]
MAAKSIAIHRPMAFATGFKLGRSSLGPRNRHSGAYVRHPAHPLARINRNDPDGSGDAAEFEVIDPIHGA